MSQKNDFVWNFNLDKDLERSLLINDQTLNEDINFMIKYSKFNQNIQFDVKNYEKYRNGDKTISIYRNLSKSIFAELFLDLRTSDDSKIDVDYRNKYFGVYSDTKCEINRFMKESHSLFLTDGNKDHHEDNLMIFGWNVINIPNYSFYFVQRKQFNKSLNKDIVRTAAIEISDYDSNELLELKYNNFVNKE